MLYTSNTDRIETSTLYTVNVEQLREIKLNENIGGI